VWPSFPPLSTRFGNVGKSFLYRGGAGAADELFLVCLLFLGLGRGEPRKFLCGFFKQTLWAGRGKTVGKTKYPGDGIAGRDPPTPPLSVIFPTSLSGADVAGPGAGDFTFFLVGARRSPGHFHINRWGGNFFPSGPWTPSISPFANWVLCPHVPCGEREENKKNPGRARTFGRA